ncbi:MAG: hypothetical protein K2L91_04750 [Duncaniella sp.]|mgnify:CR=1 FL=1|nr:hypothetical protein [Duncaniella sp.]MDE6327819.1 hypothetical protein [Duncaniella sp.]MDE6466032.1 hypothetical protein [Duncaniella sp.]
MAEYDEKAAVKAMRAAIGTDTASSYPDDELINIIDIIWDWYDDNGLLDIDAEADDEDVNVGELTAHVRRMLSKDKLSPIRAEDIEPLVAAELAYEQSLDPLTD